MTIRRSKTDQEGQGYTVAIPTGESLRPVAAVKAWLDAAGMTEGPLFRPGQQGQRGFRRAPNGLGSGQSHQGLRGAGRARCSRSSPATTLARRLRHQRGRARGRSRTG